MSVTTAILFIVAGIVLGALIAWIFLARFIARKDSSTQSQPSDGATRHIVTVLVLTMGAGGIVELGTLVITKAQPGTEGESVKLVFGAILPLLASWVGTVLAYYYSRENLTAATRSVTDLAKEISGSQKLAAIAVKDKMIPVDRVQLPAKTLNDVMALKLTTVLGFFDTIGVQRLPIWRDDKVAMYIVHRSKVTDYIAKNIADPALKDRTVKDLVEDPAFSTLFKQSFAFVSLGDTLADAKAKMESTPSCEDIFVTGTGRETDAVVGWVTDNEITRAATL